MIEKIKPYNALFVVCPFCQIECFLRTKFGDDIFFITAPASILNFNTEKVNHLREFIKRENITDIYLVNDVSCSFIEEAINGEKIFGLNCEKQLRVLMQESNSETKTAEPLIISKELLARNNVWKQLQCLNSEEIFRNEISDFEINLKGIITDQESSTIDFTFNFNISQTDKS